MVAIDVVDFFSGCGGTSAGLRSAGMRILAAVDNDPDAAQTFAANFPEATLLRRDIRGLETGALEPLISDRGRQPLLFAICAPCQPFSKQRRGRDAHDERVPLLWEVDRFVTRYKPELIFVENVPGLQSLAEQMGPFQAFVDALTAAEYHVVPRTIDSCDYGVPQRRKRLVLIASRLGDIAFPRPTHGPRTPNAYSTVRQWIGDLPPIAAGTSHPAVPNHRASGLSLLNLERIRATPEGGGHEHWPERLLPPCHRNGYQGYSDVYGRMRWDSPATGLTTRCISFSNGRFGHPKQDRAISVREAACLQTFPRSFAFHGSMTSMSRQIGNAVPVLLAERIGRAFTNHVAAKWSGC